MAYTPTTWVTGDIITEELLNHAESGIVNASSKVSGGFIDTSSTSVTVSFTGTLLGARCVMNGEEVLTTIDVDGQDVTFTCAEEPDYIVFCYVIYI